MLNNSFNDGRIAKLVLYSTGTFRMNLHANGYGARTGRLSFRKGETIYCQGDDAVQWFEVVSGVVRTCRFLPDGRRQLTSFCYPGDVFGLEDGPHADAAEAIVDVELLAWTWPTDLLGNQPLERGLQQALASARRSIKLFGCRTAEERVAAFLLEICLRSRSPVIHLPMTRADIADHLSLTLHTVSRTISDLSRRGIIALLGHQNIRILEKEALQELAGEVEQEHAGGAVNEGTSEHIAGDFLAGADRRLGS